MTSISFVNPYFLWALSLLALPIIVHLFSFRKYKTIYFTDVNLLKNITQSGKSKKQLKHWLILLLRCLMLLFLVLAFAQPVQKNSSNTKGAKKLVCIYVDNSFSMAGAGKEGELLGQAKVLADQIIKKYQVNDRFQIISNDFSPKDQFLHYQENAQNLVADIAINYRSKCLDEVYQKQLNLIEKNKDYQAEIYWLSDFQSLQDSNRFTSTKVPIHLLPLSAEKYQNVSLDSLWFESPIRAINGKDELKVRVFNHGSEPIKNYTLTLNINGKSQLGAVDLPEQTFVDFTFSYNVPKESNVKGKISIDDQPVKFDNELYFSYQIPSKIKVLVVSSQEDFVKIPKRIFANDSLIQLTNVSPFNLDYSALSSFQLIVLGQLDEMDSGLSNALANYVSSKQGQLLVFPSSKINVNQYNYLGNKLSSFAYQQKDTSKKELLPIKKNIPFFKGVFDESKQDDFVKIKMPQLNQHYSLKALGVDHDVLIQKSNESPYFIKSNGVYVFAGGITKECSNLAKHSLIVPLFYQLVFASVMSKDINYVLDQSKLIPLQSDWKKPIQLMFADSVNFNGKVIGNYSNGNLLVDENFKYQGFYALKTNNSIPYNLAFNFNRKESIQVQNTSKLLDGIIEKYPKIDRVEADEKQVDQYISQQINGVDYWQECLVLSLFFLAAEMLFIRRLKTNS